MAKHIYLLRHAKSSWKDESLKDFDRPLAKRGLATLPQVGAWLRGRQVQADVILCSPAVRARASMEGICDAWGVARDRIQYLDRLYLADRSTLVDIIRQQDDACQTLMILAHNPGLDHVLNFLVNGPIPLTKKGKLMTTANIAHLVVGDDWQEVGRDGARLVDLVRPQPAPAKPAAS